jgi:hypothetical protein
MAQYRYGGKEPVHEDDGGILRPLELREFDEPPGEPWEAVEAPEPPAEPAAEPDQAPAKAASGNGGK